VALAYTIAMPSPPVQLTINGATFAGRGFTADSRYALWLDGKSGTVAAVKAQPIAGGLAFAVSQGGQQFLPLDGARVLVEDDVTPIDMTHNRAWLVAVDAPSGDRIVALRDADAGSFRPVPGARQVVASVSAGASLAAGLYLVPIP
jgi:hypothetical protein